MTVTNAAASASVSGAARTRLDALVHVHPELAEAATLLRALLAAANEADDRLPDRVPSADAARARLHHGIPALEGEPLLDGDALRRNVSALERRLRATGSAGDAAATRVSAALAAVGAGPDGDALAAAALAGAWENVTDLAPRVDVDEYALVAILDYAARPALRRGAAALRDVIAESRWSRGRCPACGAPPLLAELRATAGGAERERVLRCGRCAAAWSYALTRCAGCGERDHRQLISLHADGEGEFRRIDCCERCKGYVKAIAVLAPLSPDELLEEDLATAGLDLVAVERGYARAGTSRT